MNMRYLSVPTVLLSLAACQALPLESIERPATSNVPVQIASQSLHNITSPNISHSREFAVGSINRFMFTKWAGPDLPVWIYAPDNIDVHKAPILFVMHGTKRDPHRYIREWVEPARANGLIIIAPEFSKTDFPKSAGYNLGNVFRKEGKGLQDEAIWSFSAIEPIFDVVRRAVDSRQEKYSIYGHSAGSQFVHRFLYYKPNARAHQYLSANAGWYTVPDMTKSYPYGLKGAGVSEEMLKKALSKNVLILLGDKDNDPNHKSLRRTDEAMQQGPHRYARGLSYHMAGQKQADKYGVNYHWTIQIVPGVAHKNGQMAVAAASSVD
ncbi:hypothetical protein [Sphingorhabdus sp. Alg239-R122]|uniref:hypothetical protein n=1 Tax=Sphingorhabdus sp. Alg239-R122 TaxID=2305989 RepID=UPI0013DBC760|nr:hypothetical protein [Sphingorhabdus sp. Alg239-R122]